MLTNHPPPIGAFSVIVKTDGSFEALLDIYLVLADHADHGLVVLLDHAVGGLVVVEV